MVATTEEMSGMGFGMRFNYYGWAWWLRMVAGLASLVDGLVTLLSLGLLDLSLRPRVAEFAVRRMSAKRRREGV